MTGFKGGLDRQHRKAKIIFGETNKCLPALSMPCFEQRHGECTIYYSNLVFAIEEKCECPCHKITTNNPKGERE